VINERGYEAASFQAIASRAGLSRPTMHYYFHTREEIYDCLVAEAYSIVADCIGQARREDTLLGFFAGFIVDHNDMALIAKQLHRLTAHGLLDQWQAWPSLTIAPPAAAAVSVDDYAETWQGLTG
jgi:AcrR family transcriptional regulator